MWKMWKMWKNTMQDLRFSEDQDGPGLSWPCDRFISKVRAQQVAVGNRCHLPLWPCPLVRGWIYQDRAMFCHFWAIESECLWSKIDELRIYWCVIVPVCYSDILIYSNLLLQQCCPDKLWRKPVISRLESKPDVLVAVSPVEWEGEPAHIFFGGMVWHVLECILVRLC